MWNKNTCVCKEYNFSISSSLLGKRCYDVKNTSWNEVSRNLDGDNELIHTLYLQLYEKLFRVAYRMMGSSESAEDLVQKTFLLALFQGEALRAHPCP